jgi:hypothetical protein
MLDREIPWNQAPVKEHAKNQDPHERIAERKFFLGSRQRISHQYGNQHGECRPKNGTLDGNPKRIKEKFIANNLFVGSQREAYRIDGDQARICSRFIGDGYAKGVPERVYAADQQQTKEYHIGNIEST